jgi:carbon-monoxide dehydrogenase medium subunit
VKAFDYHAPRTLDEAVALVAEHGPTAKLLAGGTDLIIFMQDGKLAPEVIIDITRIAALNGIEYSEKTGLRLGAGTKMRAIESSPVIQQYYPHLVHGAAEVGSIQMRNLATIGGNVCTASPAGDTLPPLLAGDAVAVLVGPDGEREVPLDAFWTGPGQTVMAPHELLKALRLPPPGPRSSGAYFKLAERKAMDLAFVGVAATVTLNGGGDAIEDVRIALGAVAPTVIRATDAEAILRGEPIDDARLGQAGRAAREATHPISDQRASADYRLAMVDALTQRVVRRAVRAAMSP